VKSLIFVGWALQNSNGGRWNFPKLLHNFGQHCKWNLLHLWVGTSGISREADANFQNSLSSSQFWRALQVKSLTFLSWVLWNSTGGRCTSLNFWSSAQFRRTLEVKSRTVASWVFIWSQGDEEGTFFWITGQFFTIMQETMIKWVPYSTNAVRVVDSWVEFQENKWYASMQLIKEKPCRKEPHLSTF
jgi:hypothetical protein